MPVKIIFENERWKQELKIIEDRNISFKTRLIDLLATPSSKHQLERLEYFQSRFLKTDEQLCLLRHEVREQLLILQHLNPADDKKITADQKRLEAKMNQIKQDFHKLTAEFNGYP